MTDQHTAALTKLCRFCGLFLTKDHFNFPSCEETNEKILECFYIDVGIDIEIIHPQKMCQKCYSTLKNISQRNTTTPHYIIQWTKHSNTNCFACSQVEKLKKGGRPKKRKRQGPPSTTLLWTRQDSDILRKQLPPTTLVPQSIEHLQNKFNPNLEVCTCKICQSIMVNPVMNIKCQRSVCFNCLVSRVEGNRISGIKCLLCDELANPNLYVVSTTISKLIENLQIECKNSCGTTYGIKDSDKKESHEDTCFGKSRHSTSIKEIFMLGPEDSIPRVVEEATIHVIKKKLTESKLPNKRIEFKTGGSRVMHIKL